MLLYIFTASVLSWPGISATPMQSKQAQYAVHAQWFTKIISAIRKLHDTGITCHFIRIFQYIFVPSELRVLAYSQKQSILVQIRYS
jgi:hypothetical protein